MTKVLLCISVYINNMTTVIIRKNLCSKNTNNTKTTPSPHILYVFPAKIFPSTLRVNRTFEEAMNNPQSPEFEKTAKEIIAAVGHKLTLESGLLTLKFHF